MRVQVEPYNAAWQQRFALIRTQLESALTGVDIVGIEHVGSTAVVDLPAKPVIDVDVVVRRGQLAAAIAALEAHGYLYEGELGIPDRHAMRCFDNEPRRNVYVVIDGCLALRNHLAVRDALRDDPELRRRYGELKLSLALRYYDNMAGYVADKSVLLQEILERAGIDENARAEIAAVNQ